MLRTAKASIELGDRVITLVSKSLSEMMLSSRIYSDESCAHSPQILTGSAMTNLLFIGDRRAHLLFIPFQVLLESSFICCVLACTSPVAVRLQ